MKKIQLKCPEHPIPYGNNPNPFFDLKTDLFKLGYTATRVTTNPIDYFIAEHVVFANTNTVMMLIYNEKMLLDNKVRELLLEYVI